MATFRWARRLRSQRGSQLILLLGITAALAILASSMIMLLGNVRHNTSKDRSRAKSFNVAEAGVDLAQATLWTAWPSSTERSMVDLTEVDLGPEFTESPELPGLDMTVHVFDDVDPTRSWDGPTVDSDGNVVPANGELYVESTAVVSGVTTRVQVKVKRETLNFRVRENTALYSTSTVNIQGTGSNNPIGADPPASSATTYSADINISGNADFPNANFPLEDIDTTGVTADDIFPKEVVDQLVIEARESGRYFETEDDVDWHLVTEPVGEPSWPHLVVIGSGDLRLPPNGAFKPDPLWSEEFPGVILVLNGDMIFSGNQEIYGIIYCQSAFTGAGTPDVHGMVVAEDYADLKGDRTIKYNPNVINNLNQMISQTVRIMKNTWREVDAR